MPKRRVKLPAHWINETAHSAPRTLLGADEGLRRVGLRDRRAYHEAAHVSRSRRKFR